MDEDIFPDYDVMNTNRRDSTSFKKLLRSTSPSIVNNIDDAAKDSEESEIKCEALSTKTAVEYLLNGNLKSVVCRYCLNTSPALSELDQVMQIAGTGALYKVTIREMMACFYPYKVNQDPNFPEKICQNCLDRALNAYLFTQQCERAERALLNCFDDIYEKLDKLDPINRPKKRGRQKLNPNYNIIHAEHEKVIDYAEPVINIINIGAESLTKEPEWNEFECKKCWQVLPNMESLLNHEITHPKFMWYHCRLCGKSFPKLTQLKKHHTQVHIHGKGPKSAPEKKFCCNECGNTSDTYSQHLQHIEKHKFKRVMKDIIEKKTDKLCLVCLDKGADLVELDKMICVHGGHPELMGDKTLHTILASTLPDNKPYKYRELHVPHKAKIMTITKRKRNFDEIKPKKDIFILALPTIITEATFKTNHFYNYVFCEPKLTDVTNDNNNEKNDTPKITEIVEESNNNNVEVNEGKSGTRDDVIDDETDVLVQQNKCMTDDKDLMETNNNIVKAALIRDGKTRDSQVDLTRRTPSYESDNIIQSTLEETDQPTKKMKYSDAIVIEQEITKPMAMDQLFKITKDKPDKYCFSYPSLEDGKCKNMETTMDDSETVAFNKYTFKFTEPDYEYSTTNKEQKENTSTANISAPDMNWLFSKSTKTTNLLHKEAENLTQAKENDKCQLCWVFKHLKQCEYCKKPIETAQTNHGTPKNAIEATSNLQDTVNVEPKAQPHKDHNKIDKSPSWQCKICLTENNPDRFTCVCCESNKRTDNGNIKITFGNNHFFANLQKDTLKEKDTSFENERNIVHEATVVEFKGVIENENKIDDSIVLNEDLTAQMDVEPDYNAKDEQMDIEENPSIPNVVQNFFAPMNAPVSTPLPNTLNTLPYFSTNLQFNIGSPGLGNRKPRKLRVSRTMSRAFHK